MKEKLPDILFKGFLILFALLQPLYTSELKEPRFRSAAALGMGLSFLNLPGYLVATFVPLFHTFVLFLVSGATCGLWVGWQVWRSTHPEAGWLPHECGVPASVGPAGFMRQRRIFRRATLRPHVRESERKEKWPLKPALRARSCQLLTPFAFWLVIND